MAKFYGFTGAMSRCGDCDRERNCDYYGREVLCRECMNDLYLTEVEGKAIRVAQNSDRATVDGFLLTDSERRAMKSLASRGLVEVGHAEGDMRRTVYSVTRDGRLAIDRNPTVEEVAASNREVTVTVWHGWDGTR